MSKGKWKMAHAAWGQLGLGLDAELIYILTTCGEKRTENIWKHMAAPHVDIRQSCWFLADTQYFYNKCVQRADDLEAGPYAQASKKTENGHFQFIL